MSDDSSDATNDAAPTTRKVPKRAANGVAKPKSVNGVKAKSMSVKYRLFQTDLSLEVLVRVNEYWRRRDQHVVDQDRPRPDLAASGALKARVEEERGPKSIGHVQGVPVGAQFVERCEMVVAGLHDHWLNGIDTVGAPGGSDKAKREDHWPRATSIIMSGGYEVGGLQ
jgi:euchromatic histone-lysine N-methyltransferase